VSANPLTQTPVLFIDTAGANLDDELEPEGFSKRNPGEAQLVVRLVEQLLHSGVAQEEIAVIAPYAAQVRLLRNLIHQQQPGSNPADRVESKIDLQTASGAAGENSAHSKQSFAESSGLPALNLEIDTVDGFQGREKEAVIISLVVSNNRNEIGFLADTRRINVALTRARRKLIVIGDSATLGGHEFYSALVEYMQSIDAYQSVWQWQEF
jgi:ATP-dependent RNA/DNA helicase IGHMBP2